MKVLNGTKLMLDDHGDNLDSFRISLESFRSFRGPLLHKPVTGQELFFAVSYSKLALVQATGLEELTTRLEVYRRACNILEGHGSLKKDMKIEVFLNNKSLKKVMFLQLRGRNLLPDNCNIQKRSKKDVYSMGIY